MKLLKIVIAPLLFVFLIACSTPLPAHQKFDGQWRFAEEPNGEHLACLNQADTEKLRVLLLDCRNANP